MDERYQHLTARADFVQVFVSTQVASTVARCEYASATIQKRIDALQSKDRK